MKAMDIIASLVTVVAILGTVVILLDGFDPDAVHDICVLWLNVVLALLFRHLSRR
jgi:hypothetical protein